MSTPTIDQHYITVEAAASERLDQLHAAYADAKAEADAAAARLKTITDGIKAELQAAVPDEERIELIGSDGPPLRLVHTESWRIDARKLKREDPEMYVRYATKSSAWRLTAGKDGVA